MHGRPRVRLPSGLFLAASLCAHPAQNKRPRRVVCRGWGAPQRTHPFRPILAEARSSGVHNWSTRTVSLRRRARQRCFQGPDATDSRRAANRPGSPAVASTLFTGTSTIARRSWPRNFCIQVHHASLQPRCCAGPRLSVRMCSRPSMRARETKSLAAREKEPTSRSRLGRRRDARFNSATRPGGTVCRYEAACFLV
jgi:hypothetical protein